MTADVLPRASAIAAGHAASRSTRAARKNSCTLAIETGLSFELDA